MDKRTILIFPFITLLLIGCNFKGGSKKEESKSEENCETYEKDSEYIDIFDDDILEESGDEDSGSQGEVTLASISVIPPTKLTYEMGELLDFSGLCVFAIYSDASEEEIELNQLSITSINTYKLGEHKIVVKYQNKTNFFNINVVRTYSEPLDSVEGIDVSNISELTETFSVAKENYTSKTISFFNSIGAYDYYRHYQKNYVQAKNNFLTSSSFYNYPYLEEYLDILNTGYLNRSNNLYSFSLNGSSIDERLSSTINDENLILKKENARYQNEMFTLEDINEEYLQSKAFTRISEHKYEARGKEVCEDFIDICAPGLINQGSYMTFSRVTIEINPLENISYRIRLYASNAQTGKLIEDSLDQTNKPNWYLLFSEALISNVGTTTFAPASSLLS